MALRDWNGDGNRNMADDFIEYQIYKDCNDNSNGGGSGNGGCFILIITVISGLFGQAFVYNLLDIEIDNVPVAVMIILWVVISSIVGVVFSVWQGL